MDIQKSDRIGAIPQSGFSGLISVALGALVFAATAGIAFFGSNLDTLKGELEQIGLVKRPDFTALYTRFGVPLLPARIEARTATQEALAKLTREPCDQHAIFALSKDVEAAHEERWAADALVGWSAHCGSDSAGALRQAASLFIGLHDDPRAFAIVKGLITAHPHVADYWYLKGKAEVGLGRVDDALLSYANTIHLEPNPTRVGSWVFYEMSDLYAASGHFCEAIGPIQDYVSLDAAARNTGNAQRLMTDYASKGHCTAFAAGSETFPVADANVIRTRVSINGVSGLFIVDTGASFVTVTSTFARKAHLDANGPAHLLAVTANGAVYDRLTPAGIIKVGRVEAKQVPVAIQDSSMGPIDGLLGRSFLSRFDVTIAANHWSLQSKASVAR
jgi:hypothetical protein